MTIALMRQTKSLTCARVRRPGNQDPAPYWEFHFTFWVVHSSTGWLFIEVLEPLIVKPSDEHYALRRSLRIAEDTSGYLLEVRE